MSAGYLKPDWLAMARLNARGGDCSVEDAIAEQVNAEQVSIDAEGSVWIYGDRGRWLTQDEIDVLCARIDRASR